MLLWGDMVAAHGEVKGNKKATTAYYTESIDSAWISLLTPRVALTPAMNLHATLTWES